MQKAGAGSTRKGRRLKLCLLSADPVRQGGVRSSLQAGDRASADLHRVVRCPTAGPPEREIVRSSDPARVYPSPDNILACRSAIQEGGATAMVKRGGGSVFSIGAARLPAVVVIGCRSVQGRSCLGAG